MPAPVSLPVPDATGHADGVGSGANPGADTVPASVARRLMG